MENENEYELSFTAEEVDARLRKAGEAVLITEQTLTPEQQKQARANIGAVGHEEFEKTIGMIATFESVPFAPVNVIEGATWSTGAYWDDNGVLQSSQYTTKYTSLSELIPVEPSATYQLRSFAGEVKIFDRNKTVLHKQTNYSIADTVVTSLTASETAAYMAISCQHHMYTEYGVTVDKLSVLRTTPTAEESSNGRGKVTYKFSDHSIGLEKMEKDALSVISPLRGKVIVNFGDSIFGNRRPPEDISTELARLTGATVYNCGFGGCQMSIHPLENYNPFSMCNLADAIATNSWTTQDAGAAASGMPSYYPEALATLKGLDFSKVDVITIVYGANDFAAPDVLDNENNKTDTSAFGGALRYSIEKLLTAYPHLKVFICSTIYRYWNDADIDSDSKVNSNGDKLTDFVAKAKEIAEEYHLPFIDNYYGLGFNKFNRNEYFPATDGTHPNAIGNKIIAAHIAKGLF